MSELIKITANPAQGSCGPLPALQAGRSPLCLELGFEAGGPLPEGAELVLTAHEIFTTATKALFSGSTGELGQVMGRLRREGPGTYPLLMPPTTLVLEPGCWHLLVDVMEGEQSLAGTDAGSAVVYSWRPGESPRHALAGFNLACTELGFDRQAGLYPRTWRGRLPPSVDPFSDRDAAEFRHRYILREGPSPGEERAGGMGFLRAAHAFAALGEEARADYCEEALYRIADDLSRVAGPDQEQERDGAGDTGRAPPRRVERALGLEFLSRAYFYFRFGRGGNKDFARQILEKAGAVFRSELEGTIGPGCGGGGCHLRDGQVLASAAWYCLAHKAEHGRYFSPEAQSVLMEAASEMLGRLKDHRGWYDADCPGEEGAHTWRGNLHLLSGLLPTYRMVQTLAERGQGEAARIEPLLAEGIREAMRFLTHTSGHVTGRPAFLPSAVPPSLVGELHEVCEEYLLGCGPEPAVRRLPEHAVRGIRGRTARSLADINASGALLALSEEYAALESSPPLPWDAGG